MENGTFVHRESQTYRRKVLANEWQRRREYEMDQERASGQAVYKKISVGEPLRDYVSAAENVTEWGRSKKADIARLQASGRADLQATRLTVQDLMGYTKKRRMEDEAGPATVLNDMVWLRQVFLHASAARGVDAPLQVLDRAKSELLRTHVIAKPARRSRRLLPEEESKLLEHFASRDGRASILRRDLDLWTNCALPLTACASNPQMRPADVSTLPPAAVLEYVTALGVIFEDCRAAYADMAAKADGHAADAALMSDSWPNTSR